MPDRHKTLTSAIGSFIFLDGVPLQAAKNLRDEITSVVRTRPDGIRIRTSAEAINYANQMNNSASEYLVSIGFD